MDPIRRRPHQQKFKFNPQNSSLITSAPTNLSATSSQVKAKHFDAVLEEVIVSVNLARAKNKPPPPDPTLNIDPVEIQHSKLNYTRLGAHLTIFTVFFYSYQC